MSAGNKQNEVHLMKLTRILIAFAAVFFTLTAAASAGNAGAKAAQPTRVIIVGWDGAEYQEVRALYDAGQLPNLAALGSLSTMYITGITSTLPSWAEMFTGLGPEETGEWSNTSYNPIPMGLTIFEQLKTGMGVYNIFVAGKRQNLGVTGNQPYANAVWSFDAYSVDKQDMRKVYNTASLMLNDYYLYNSSQPLLAFIHTGEPDYQGHSYGVESPEYAGTLQQLDNMLGRLRSDLAKKGMTNTYILVVSDHGFNHLNVPFPRPGKGEQNKHHRLAPYGIIASNFRTFPDGLTNIELAGVVLGLFASPPVLRSPAR